MGFSRQEYWSGLLCPPPGDLPDPGIKPTSLISRPLAGGFFTTSATWEAPLTSRVLFKFSKKLLIPPQKKQHFSTSPSGLRPGSVLQDSQERWELQGRSGPKK